MEEDERNNDRRSRRDMGEGEGGPEEYVRVKLPNRKKNEIFGVVDQALGGGHLKILCQDGKMRLGRIRGKLKKRMWMREGDLVIVAPWDFQNDKCDVLYRYTRIQAQNLLRRGVVPKHLETLI
ncbi:MAG: translation initiation factor eIF-1A [Thermoplasmatota archaeon]